MTAPNLPQVAPSEAAASLGRAGVLAAGKHPLKIGGGANSDTDYSAQVASGTIDSAVGSFANVSGIKTISSSSGSNGFFTLQINSDYFNNQNDVPTCSGAAVPALCQGWEQFVYTDGDDGDHGRLYIQYWMINYNQSNCPPSWQQTSQRPGQCFFNSPATSLPNPALSTFGQLVLGGAAANGGQDEVTLTTATGMYSTHAYDNVLNLSTHWTAAEFNVFGAANSSEANFNAGVSIDVHLAAAMSPPGRLSCITQSATGESANLFIQTPCTVALAGNEIQFTETSGPYANGPVITGVSPSSVSAAGGDQITITGLRLGNPVSVTFNLLPVKPTQSNATQIVFTAPACSALGCASGPGAAVSVTGTVGPTGSGMTATSYGGPIAQTPVVVSVSPASGPQLSTITVTGAGFYNGTPNPPQFYIGGGVATNVNCPDVTRNTQCSMIVPAEIGPARAPIGIGGPGDANTGPFWTYAGSAVPFIVVINPTHGPQAGGTPITLTGANFTQTMEAGFNGNNYVGITGDCPTPNQCSFQTPRGQGQVSITVRDYSSGLESGPASQMFTYDAPPPSGTLQPTSGPSTGGTATEADLISVDPTANIAIQFNFSSGAAPVSGAVCKPYVTNAANTYCTFTSPPLPTGMVPPVAVPVIVTEAGTTLQLGSFTYTTPSLGSVSPGMGPRTGGTNVTVHVNNLLAAAGATVDFTFNGTPTPIQNAVCTVDAGNTGNSTCTATTPPLPANETTPIQIPVSVVSQGKSVTVGSFQYGVKPPPKRCPTVNGKVVCPCQKSSSTGVCL